MIYYLLTALILGANIYVETNDRFIVSVTFKIAFAVLFIIFWTLAYKSKRISPKRKRIYMFILFAYYIWILSNMLFFDIAFGRTGEYSSLPFQFYDSDINLIPFDTIKFYINGYKSGNIAKSLVFINLLGNLLAFAPMGVFLPSLFKCFRNFFSFSSFNFFIICCVEFLQYHTQIGSMDIDDLILNLCGAIIVWLIVQIKWIKRKMYI